MFPDQSQTLAATDETLKKAVKFMSDLGQRYAEAKIATKTDLKQERDKLLPLYATAKHKSMKRPAAKEPEDKTMMKKEKKEGKQFPKKELSGDEEEEKTGQTGPRQEAYNQYGYDSDDDLWRHIPLSLAEAFEKGLDLSVSP